MRHALVKLYLYTNLSTEDISGLMTALAQQQMGERFKSQKRSTQTALHSLLADKRGKLDYLKLRPRSREAARLRVAWQRSVRDRRSQKALARRPKPVADGRSRDISATSNPTSNSASNPSNTFSSEALAYPQCISHTYVSSYGPNNSIEDLGALQCPIPDPKDGQPTAPVNCGRPAEHKHVRLSWVRQVIPKVSRTRPSSSMLMEIRSLLSWRSV